jgi:glycosyltransferase involved in cell wall biosynthesis
MAKPTLTLCMIVKDESHIIKECLESVSKIIDRYDITDTGSTDGTQDLIREFFEEKGIPGEVHQSDWNSLGGEHN